MSDIYDEGIESGSVAPARGLSRAERRGQKSQMKELLLLLPRMVRLVLRLARDPRVSRSDKVILGGTVLYVLVPLDFLPDMVPFIGQIDDAYLVAISVLRMLNRADPAVVREHWDGNIDIQRLATSVVNVASNFLPAPIRNALSARVEVREPRRLRVAGGQPQEQPPAAPGK
jgi:uncharacterized membrane protein YkvA (DUF1232 family)